MNAYEDELWSLFNERAALENRIQVLMKKMLMTNIETMEKVKWVNVKDSSQQHEYTTADAGIQCNADTQTMST